MKDAKLSRTRISPRQAAFAKAMRLNMTIPERKLWKALRISGARFQSDLTSQIFAPTAQSSSSR
jgi:very-short-patch-repair endonuclease